MKSNSQLLTFILLGVALLYKGSQAIAIDGSDIMGWMYVAGGMVTAFIGFYKSGDERANTDQYRYRQKHSTHIKSIEPGNVYQHILTDTEQDQIEKLIEQEKIIEALAFYRNVTGHSFLEAKQFIDKTVSEMNQREK